MRRCACLCVRVRVRACACAHSSAAAPVGGGGGHQPPTLFSVRVGRPQVKLGATLADVLRAGELCIDVVVGRGVIDVVVGRDVRLSRESCVERKGTWDVGGAPRRKEHRGSVCVCACVCVCARVCACACACVSMHSRRQRMKHAHGALFFGRRRVEHDPTHSRLIPRWPVIRTTPWGRRVHFGRPRVRRQTVLSQWDSAEVAVLGPASNLPTTPSAERHGFEGGARLQLWPFNSVPSLSLGLCPRDKIGVIRCRVSC